MHQTLSLAAYQYCYPSPSRERTKISISEIAKAKTIEVDIYNELGQPIKQLNSIFNYHDEYHFLWNHTNYSGIDMPAGLYFVRINTINESIVRKIIII